MKVIGCIYIVWNIIVTLFGKTRLNENSIVLHFQCTLTALIMHYNVLIMVLNAFVMLVHCKNVDNVQQMFENG